MKIALALAFVAVAMAMEGFVPKKHLVDGQYTIRVDENILKNKAEIQKFADMIEKKYKIYHYRITEVGNAKFLYVKGEHKNVMKAEHLPGVKYIAKNQYVTIAQEGQCLSEPHPGVWGLDRIDQRELLPYDDPFGSDGEFSWGSSGSSVFAYVADTGIDLDHPAFEGRARWGFTAPAIPNDGDYNGHGTHCAGTIGSRPYGVAKKVILVDVKVLNDKGGATMQEAIDGLAWIREDHLFRTGIGPNAKSVVNMSLGGYAYDPLDEAIRETVQAGVVVVVAAGNSDDDACIYTPAREETAITVGASDITDTSAYFTNYGSCVDIFAPGVNILSSVIDNRTAYYSGTSMSAPHVAGVVASYQGRFQYGPPPGAIARWLESEATRDALHWYHSGHATSPNLFLHSACGSS